VTKQFSIKKISEEGDRPPYSYKVEEYFEDFVHENILKPFDIIVNDEWKTILSVMLLKKDEQSLEGINFYEPEMIEDEKVKFYPVTIYIEDVYENDKPVENIVSLYFQIISIFFLSYYKRIEPEYMMEMKEKIDWDHLLAIPYPAPVKEQKYVGDNL
jgi:hypothetical protein